MATTVYDINLEFNGARVSAVNAYYKLLRWLQDNAEGYNVRIVHDDSLGDHVRSVLRVTLCALTPHELRARLYDYCEDAGEDCVAVREVRPDGTDPAPGALIGPRAAAWGSFNPEFFVAYR